MNRSRSRSTRLLAGAAALTLWGVIGCGQNETDAESARVADASAPSAESADDGGARSPNDPPDADERPADDGSPSDAADDRSAESESAHEHTNRLIDETSPYLLQHAHNPVDWYPWGDEAFERAQEEDKPIFLSVGYSTCYWCHVMERESFEDEDVAEILNEHYIAIKLDREERPDVDEQYMMATQLSTGRGGWPNSVWLTPDGRPWIAGTYFPKQRFMRILRQMADMWNNQRGRVEQQADQLADRINEVGTSSYTSTVRPINAELIERASNHLQRTFDPRNGGFGGAPKFPPHGRLRLIASLYEQTDDDRFLDMLTETLDAMALGGIHDHIGGGFHRYATDGRWFLPHFEKMLYDNAQLMRAYTDGYRFTSEQRYADLVEDIYFWVDREMTDPHGVFYSAIDSEVDAVEGESYVWFTDEVIEVLGPERGELFAEVYGFEDRGNYVEESSGHRPGNNIPHLSSFPEEIADRRGRDPESFKSELAQMRMELLEVRDQRPQPHLDDKVIAGWNALMIEALAYAGRHLEEPKYVDAAAAAGDRLFDLLDGEEYLLRVYRDGRAHQPAYLDDYASLTLASIELHEATGEQRWLDRARRLADAMLELFEDSEDGAFFFSARHHDDLLLRSKGLSGTGNMPSPNGLAARALYRLGETTDDARYLEAAEETLTSLSGVMWRSVHGNEDLLVAVTDHYVDDVRSQGGQSSREQPTRRAADPNELELDPDVSIDGHPVSVEGYASHAVVAPGETVLTAVALDIAEGWHLYGPNRDVERVQPTSVTPKRSDIFQPRSISAPEPVRKHDELLGKELETFSGRIWYMIPVRIRDDAPAGRTAIEIDTLTQACDHKRCLPPKTETVRFEITIDEDAGRRAARHRSLFTALSARRSEG